MFKFLPLLLTKYVLNNVNSIIFNIIDGTIRMLIFIIYLIMIGFMSDVKRLFQYHGAEHKAVNCYESGKELNIKNAMKSSRFHKRCGTAFVLYNFLVSIIVFSIVPISLSLWKLFLYRLPLLIPIAGISYEIVKSNIKILEPLRIPGMWLQLLTTREPNEKEMEVAIKALKAAL